MSNLLCPIGVRSEVFPDSYRKTIHERNEKILQSRLDAWNKTEGARVGDFLRLPGGIYTRFTYHWGDDIQTGGGNASYYLGNGYLSYSGGLDHGVKVADIIPTDKTKKGYCWFFSQDDHRAYNNVSAEIDCRVFVLRDGADTSGLPQCRDGLK